MNRSSLSVLLALGLLASTAAAREPSPPTIRVALICGAMTPMIAQIAMNDGSFQRAGLRVDKYCFPGGAPAVQALVGRSVDIFIGSYEHVLRQRAHGFHVKAYGEIFDAVCCTLIAKAGSPVRDLADLRGQIVGISAAGSLSDTILREALESARLNPDRDVHIISIGQGLPMYAALESDRITAGLLAEPLMTALVADGAYKVLYASKTPFAGNVLMANTSWVRTHRDEMRTLLAVLRNVEARVRAHPVSAIAPMRKDFPNVAPRIMLQAIMHELAFVPKGLQVQRGGAETASRIELRLGNLKAPIPFAQCVDNTLVASIR